jgi:ABC-type nickel/cobalt efflux system permease component RcnA
MSKHLGEAALALLIALTFGVLFAGAGLNLPALQLVMAIIVFQLGVASWRVYYTQRVSIATTRSLRNLDEFERVQSEQHLKARYAHRERRLEQRHHAHVKRLINNVAEVSRQLTQMRDTRS